jgi:hypothetical protein
MLGNTVELILLFLRRPPINALDQMVSHGIDSTKPSGPGDLF